MGHFFTIFWNKLIIFQKIVKKWPILPNSCYVLFKKKITKCFAQNIQGMFKLKKLFQLLIATMSNLGTYICQQTYFKSCSAQIPYFPFMWTSCCRRKIISPLPFKEYLTFFFHFPLSAPSMSSMSIQPQIGRRRQRVDFMSFLPCFLSSWPNDSRWIFSFIFILSYFHTLHTFILLYFHISSPSPLLREGSKEVVIWFDFFLCVIGLSQNIFESSPVEGGVDNEGHVHTFNELSAVKWENSKFIFWRNHILPFVEIIIYFPKKYWIANEVERLKPLVSEASNRR